ncbi:MAG: C-GCAxxG-C-C family (seleno)protein [Planctomycetota bacterium]|jgi:hypothetical protein
MRVVDNAYGHPLRTEENAVMPLAGGILQHGYQCGMIWGAALAAGAQAFERFGPGPKGETVAILAAQKAVESFHALYKEINCLELTDIDKSSSFLKMFTFFVLKGGVIRCLRKMVKYAPHAFRGVDSALSETSIEAPPPPVSCAALLAGKMGCSERHATMAAGFAGGIGLCGGACGALGAAIWILGMNVLKEGEKKLDFKSPKALEVIERFLKCTDYEFECSEIVGRKFENVGDHAGYLREGGCSKIIEALAAE